MDRRGTEKIFPERIPTPIDGVWSSHATAIRGTATPRQADAGGDRSRANLPASVGGRSGFSTRIWALDLRVRPASDPSWCVGEEAQAGAGGGGVSNSTTDTDAREGAHRASRSWVASVQRTRNRLPPAAAAQ